MPVRRSIRSLQKNRVFVGTIRMVINDKVDIDIGKGHMLYMIPLIGGPGVVGQQVRVDYSSGRPVAECVGLKLETAVSTNVTTVPTSSSPKADPGTGIVPPAPHTHVLSQITNYSAPPDDTLTGKPVETPTIDNTYLYYDLDTNTMKWGGVTGGGSGALDDLTDVVVTNPQDGEVLKYDAASSSWINAIDEGGTGGGVSDAKYIVAAAHADLSDEIVVPGLAGSGDRIGVGGGTIDEEFDSTDLSAWTKQIGGSDFTYDAHTSRPSHLRLYKAYEVANNGLIYRNFDAINNSRPFEIRCSALLGGLGSLASSAFLFFIKEATWVSGSGKWCAWRIQQHVTPSNGMQLVFQSSSNGGVNGGTFSSHYTLSYMNYGPWVLRLRRTGTTSIYADFSPDGYSWIQTSSQSFSSLGMVPAQVGFYILQGGGDTFSYIDYLRAFVANA